MVFSAAVYYLLFLCRSKLCSDDLIIFSIMKDNLKTYKFKFDATIGQFFLNAPNISSPLVATWKRSNELVTTEKVLMNGGKANFDQTISLELNMYYNESKQTFEDKKTMFTFTMNTPKGDKQAGVVYIEVAQLLNNKLTSISDTYPLEKCPVKDSKVTISIVAELIGQGAVSDTMSMDSSIMQSGGTSSLSIQSKKQIPSSKKEQPKTESASKASSAVTTQADLQKDKKIEELEKEVKQLKNDKEKLLKELEKSRNRDGNQQVSDLREELAKSKTIQQKLENEIGTLREENIEHEKQLQKMRRRMEQIYDLLLGNLNSLY